MSYCPFKVHIDASTLKYLTTMKNQSGLFTRCYQELAGFNFIVIHKKRNKNSDTDALSRSFQMAESPPLAEDEYVEFYEIDEAVINFEGEVNEIKHIQRSVVSRYSRGST